MSGRDYSDEYPCPHEVEVLTARPTANHCDSDCDNCIPALKAQIENLCNCQSEWKAQAEKAEAKLTEWQNTMIQSHRNTLETAAKVKELEGESLHRLKAIEANQERTKEIKKELPLLRANIEKLMQRRDELKRRLQESTDRITYLLEDKKELQSHNDRLTGALEEIREGTMEHAGSGDIGDECLDVANKALSQTDKPEQLLCGNCGKPGEVYDSLSVFCGECRPRQPAYPGEGLQLWRDWFKGNCKYWDGVDDVESALARIRSGNDQCEGDCDECKSQTDKPDLLMSDCLHPRVPRYIGEHCVSCNNIIREGSRCGGNLCLRDGEPLDTQPDKPCSDKALERAVADADRMRIADMERIARDIETEREDKPCSECGGEKTIQVPDVSTQKAIRSYKKINVPCPKCRKDGE